MTDADYRIPLEHLIHGPEWPRDGWRDRSANRSRYAQRWQSCQDEKTHNRDSNDQHSNRRDDNIEHRTAYASAILAIIFISKKEWIYIIETKKSELIQELAQ